MATNDLEWLGTWYQQQCDGKWEHQKGMQLKPLHGTQTGIVSGTVQSGWHLSIDLRGTTAAGAAPRKLQVCALDGTFRGPWLRCTLNAHQFAGEGAEVEELIAVFRTWIDRRPPLLHTPETNGNSTSGAVSTG